MKRGALLVLAACGARTPLDVSADAAAPCDYGTIVSDVSGAPVLWNGGAPVPAGRYRVTYVDGCMKYSSSQNWTVNAYGNGPSTLWIVGDGSRIAPVPGTTGFTNGEGFATFDACVTANLANDGALQFDFAGGTLGLELEDDPYTDNVPGENGRSPTYRLTCTSGGP